MFEYFPENYAWSLTTAHLFDEIGTFHEADEVLRTLRPHAGAERRIGAEHWYSALTGLGEKLERLGGDDERDGFLLTAGRKYHRAGLYHLRAERFLEHGDARQAMAYRRGATLYRRARELSRDPVEFVDVPFQGSHLPAMLVRAAGPGPHPCMVFLQGFDSLKEWFFPVVGQSFRQRGVSVLVVDQPGAGGALRLNGLAATPRSEVPAAACVDYLETRKDIDPARIGVMGVSLGGYYAPRAAAFERRFKACICWGAIWDFGEHFVRVMEDGRKAGSIPNMIRHAMWVFGQETPDQAVAVARELTCAGFAERISCPLLILHGENDRQVPLWQAERLHAAARNAMRRKLKVFRIAEGGAEHCQINARTIAGDVMADWAATELGGNPNGVE